MTFFFQKHARLVQRRPQLVNDIYKMIFSSSFMRRKTHPNCAPPSGSDLSWQLCRLCLLLSFCSALKDQSKRHLQRANRVSSMTLQTQFIVQALVHYARWLLEVAFDVHDNTNVTAIGYSKLVFHVYEKSYVMFSWYPKLEFARTRILRPPDSLNVYENRYAIVWYATLSFNVSQKNKNTYILYSWQKHRKSVTCKPWKSDSAKL